MRLCFVIHPFLIPKTYLASKDLMRELPPYDTTTDLPSVNSANAAWNLTDNSVLPPGTDKLINVYVNRVQSNLRKLQRVASYDICRQQLRYIFYAVSCRLLQKGAYVSFPIDHADFVV